MSTPTATEDPGTGSRPRLVGADPEGLAGALLPSREPLPRGADASLVLADGAVFHGRVAAPLHPLAGEAVFTTAMGGYPEGMTDPSYRGQILVFCYPEIGIYGVDPADVESRGVYASALVVHKACKNPSLQGVRIPFVEAAQRAGRGVLEGVDTRAVTRHLRIHGTMQAVIVDGHPKAEQARGLVGILEAPPPWPRASGSTGAPTPGEGLRVALVDFGLKAGIHRALERLGAEVMVVDPDVTPAADVLAAKPTGVLLSNGPGDPAMLDPQVAYIQELLGKVPMMGVCLGHQLLGRALGATTEKLPFGHRGVNQPVRDLVNDKTIITSQNHGYALTRESLEAIEGVVVTHVHAGDDSVEGFACERLDCRSVQFHPEARPGPVDAAYLFEEFLDRLRKSS